MGPNYSISTACATANYCFNSAAHHLLRGDADIIVAGGSEAAIIPVGLGGFVACRALSTANEDPKKASRPWDKNRDGFVMGEGAGVLVLALPHPPHHPNMCRGWMCSLLLRRDSMCHCEMPPCLRVSMRR